MTRKKFADKVTKIRYSFIVYFAFGENFIAYFDVVPES